VRVLYVIDSLVPSGAERSLAAMAGPLERLGIDLHVVYLRERPGLHAELAATAGSVVSVDGPGGGLARVRRLRRLVRRMGPDLVHTTLAEANLAGRVAARTAGLPVVSSLVNVQYGPEQRKGSRVAPWKLEAARRADRATARWVTRFHAITRYVAEVMSQRLGVPRDRIDVVPRGRDPVDLGKRTPDRRSAARALLGAAQEDPILVAVGRQDRQKGLDVLLRALPGIRESVPGARLLLVGRTGNLTSELRDMVGALRLDDSVSFLGTRDDVPDLLCAADAFVFPSRWEGLGSVLLEAMALEVPIVASSIPPVREILEDGTALLVPPEDELGLGSALVEVLQDPAGSRSRARAARNLFFQRFTVDRVAQDMAAFYGRALDRQATR
jgi:glycosyltransferase involved in cell wall biosynthesis